MSRTPFIDQSSALGEALDRWRDAAWLTVDTEFVRVDTYYARLCLVQVADARHAACVDALALDLAPLFRLLADTARTKVLHAAGQDLELFVQHAGDCPRPLFDTQIASALLGWGEQSGYAALVERRLGIKVDKRLARTDWARRPLPPDALAYAVDDVRHLAAVYPPLRTELEQRGRLAWLEEECARLADPARYTVRPEDAWRWVRGLGRLAPAEQQRAARLAMWREAEARRLDRPRRWILDDEVLCRLAARNPDSLEALQTVEGLSPKVARRAGEAILQALREAPTEGAPLVADRRQTGEERRAVQKLSDALRKIAERAEISATLIATRADLECLVRDGESADIPLLAGWRRDVAGKELLKLL